MTAPLGPPKFPTLFVVATFVGAAVVAGLVLYFGLNGQIGVAIP